ncbi:MAG: TSUP family transporter [Elusimicrobiales bacterium]|nr:TSUP family transporter [Elusimicrobiales bacterium]
MEYVMVPLAALVASILSFYSGFGLGTLLMPVLAVFFPLPAAIAATAVVHGCNNLFKILLVGVKADRELVLKFGVPAIAAAFAGAWALHLFNSVSSGAAFSYVLLGRAAVITPLKLMLALLMLCFAAVDALPALKNMKFDRRYLPLGGLLSGFFGGFSGHQGALRSAFLVKTDVTPEAFVATNAVIGFLVDCARLVIYAYTIFLLGGAGGAGAFPTGAAAAAVLASVAGVLIGLKFLHKVTLSVIQGLTAVMLALIAALLGAGLI